MTRIDALRALENAAEAGGSIRPGDLDGTGLVSHQASFGGAYNGSLDAAKALHEAVLPEWFPGMSKNIHHGHWYAWVQDKATAHFSAVEPDPARAWLLAIIRALIAQESIE